MTHIDPVEIVQSRELLLKPKSSASSCLGILAKCREAVVQILFALENGGDESVVELIMGEAKLSKQHARQAYERAVAIWNMREQWDVVIGEASREYAIERIPTVEKNILRYALMEIGEAQPVARVVTEAVRLARKFSTPEAGAFVHAILHTIAPIPPCCGEITC